ncbi:LysR family transcriptional regulator [Vibrio parahaemolyticus]
MNDLNALRVFLTLMQTQSTLKAAKSLGRSQSYISKTLGQLRVDLDDPLFVRSSNRLAPTSYALSIQPKLEKALSEISDALKPAEFSPNNLDKITLHLVEPYLISCGKEIIDAIRAATSAPIELRQWSKVSESLLLTEQVDLAVHALTDKPQSIYQKYVHTGTGVLYGNLDGEYVKYVIPDLNEHIDLYKMLDSDAQATIFVDNHTLMTQLLDNCYTVRYYITEQPEKAQVNLDIALLTKASRRHEAKIQWLMALIEPILKRYTPAPYSKLSN